LDQLGLAANGYYLFDKKNEIEFNLSNLNEERQGGEMLPLPPDQLQQSEYRNHKSQWLMRRLLIIRRTSKIGGVHMRQIQNTKRVHYTGIDGSNGWGTTQNYSYQLGIQALKQIGKKRNHSLTAGAEFLKEYTFDEIKGYNYLINQHIEKLGFYAQSDWEIAKNLTLVSGARLNFHNKLDQPVLTPRISAMYKMGKWQRLRASYATGFKAPQAFEADMHIAFAAGNISRILIDPQLNKKTPMG